MAPLGKSERRPPGRRRGGPQAEWECKTCPAEAKSVKAPNCPNGHGRMQGKKKPPG